MLALLELLEAVIQGQLLLLIPLLLVEQVLKFIVVGTILLLLVLYARRVLHLRRDKTRLLPVGGQSLGNLKLSRLGLGLRGKKRELFGVGLVLAKAFGLHVVKGWGEALCLEWWLFVDGLELASFAEVLLAELRLRRHYNYIIMHSSIKPQLGNPHSKSTLLFYYYCVATESVSRSYH